MQIGDKIIFGKYEWRVLDVQSNMSLIITEDIIETRPYNGIRKEITWADCELRKYLNGDFYDKFNEIEKSRLIPIINGNPDNTWYGTTGGVDTQDNIFLLSVEEAVCKYFGDSSSLLLNRGNRKYWFGRKDENNNKRVAKLENNASWWWLRSPGHVKRAAYIHGGGEVGLNGNGVQSRGGIRPALWLSL